MEHANFFFFQAEDGIRDVAVTGVQTCALPICAFLEQQGCNSNRSSSNTAEEKKVRRRLSMNRFVHRKRKSILFIMAALDRKSTRLNSSHGYISYAVFCLKKKKD